MADLHHEEQQHLLELIAASLAPQRIGDVGAGPPSALYATASGTVYHRADCAVVVHHPDDLRVLGAGGLTGMQPRQICRPG